MTVIRKSINRIWVENEQYLSSSDLIDIMQDMVVEAYDKGYENEVIALAALIEVLSFSLIADGFNDKDKQ